MKWFRDWADLERHGEEVEILDAEFGRGVKAHRKMASCWIAMEKEAKGGGAKAFAAQMANAYSRLEERMQSKYEEAKARK